MAKVVTASSVLSLFFAAKVGFQWDLEVEEELSPPILLEGSLNDWRVKNHTDIVFIKVEFYDKNNSMVYHLHYQLQVLFYISL